jgi:hypothetical protein
VPLALSTGLLGHKLRTEEKQSQIPGWAHTVATSNLKLPSILSDRRIFLDCMTCPNVMTDVQREEREANKQTDISVQELEMKNIDQVLFNLL